MKSERLLRALSEVDNKLIEEAAPEGESTEAQAHEEKISGTKAAGHRTNRMRVWISAAACFAAVAILGIVIWQSGILKGGAVTSGDKRWPDKVVPGTPAQSGESYQIPKWDEMTVSQQYFTFEFDSASYSTRQTEIAPENVGAALGTAEAMGIDHYTDTVHKAGVTVYEINNISAKCAAAVQFEGRTDYFVYVNSEYQPETLGGFIKDLNLKETLSFGAAYYNLGKDDSVVTVEFEDLEDQTVWEMLLADESLEAVPDSGNIWLGSKMSVSVDIPLLGYENIGLWVTEDGYLVTNILDTAKIFDLGSEKTEQFVNYVLENCTGYELIYEGGEAVPE